MDAYITRPTQANLILSPEERLEVDKLQFFFDKRTQGRDTCTMQDIFMAAHEAGLL